MWTSAPFQEPEELALAEGSMMVKNPGDEKDNRYLKHAFDGSRILVHRSK
jgi:hypothetical protein